MAKVYEFLSDGSEEVESLIPLDVMRRAGVEFLTVSINGTNVINGSHGVKITTDLVFEDADFSDADLLMLPGGLPGADLLNAHEGVRRAITEQAAKGKRVAAICAAPQVLGSLGLLRGKRATCYPGFEKYLDGATYTAELVTVDGNITTGEGPAATFPYAYCLLAQLKGQAVADKIAEGMRFKHLMEK